MEVSFVVGLKARAARVETATPPALARRMLSTYGTSQLFEWYTADTIGKPVFDVDGKAAQTTAEDLLEAAMRGVRTFFGFEPRVLVASSHGGDKLSYRIFCPGFRMLIKDVKARLARLGLDNNRPFDAAIYGARQKLRMVGSIKTPQDRRVLDLRGERTEAALLDTLVQVTDDAWPLLTEPTIPTAPARDLQVAPAPKRRRGRPRTDETIPADVLRVLLDMGFRAPRFVSATAQGLVFDAQNRDSCPNCTHDHDHQNWWCIPKEDEYVVANYSQRCVTKHYPKVVEAIVPASANFLDSLALLPLETDQADRLQRLHYHDKVIKVACYSAECLACDRHHDCTTYTARELIPRHCWTLRNDDNSCRSRIFHHTSRLADKLHSLFTSPNEESLLGLFLEGHVGTIHVDRITNSVFMWATEREGGGRWRKVTTVELESYICMWLNALLQGVAGLADFKDHEKAIRHAQSKVTPGGVAKLKNQIQGRVSLQAIQDGRADIGMDSNPHLLGAGCNVIELKHAAEDGRITTLARPARPEDLVTKSIGYELPDEPVDTADVEAVFAQIYPTSRRSAASSSCTAATACSATTPPRAFSASRTGAKGDNGKSTAVRLLRRALGDDYVIDNKQNLLYEARYSTSVNQHDSGMLAFEGKRLAIMEELSQPIRTLDTSVMKQLTGGEARISVRASGCG